MLIKGVGMFHFFLVLILSFPISSWAQSWSESNHKLLKEVLAEVPVSDDSFGIWIKYKGEVIHHNSGKLFTPASISKIPTALAFLDGTSLDQLFKTWIYKTGEIKEGVLHGDLYLKGGGDPSLVSETLWLMVKELKRNDIKEVKGQVFVDESYFDDDYYSEGRQKRRVDRAYDAPVSALSFNWNSLSIYVRPGDKAGASVKVYTDPELPTVEVVNRAKTVKGKSQQLKVDRQLKNDKMIITVTGNLGQDYGEKDFYKSVGDAALWTGANFVNLMGQLGIKYQGSVSKKQVPKGADLLVEFKSWDQPRIISALSKFSNNFVAEMLTKHLGKKEDEPAAIEDGIKKISQYLERQGWSPSDFHLGNPSGFTHKNKMRADRLGELLDKARGQFDKAPEFLASLPISGVDGTLERRLQQVMKAKVRAKTGYMAGVVSLAGYLEPRQGDQEPITFVFMYNGPNKHDWAVRDLFDKLLWRLYQKS
jgi:serine-type D-Ala-D-Ala carboxypeptidase/endopeptidase (penicillin-binding protein 4)